MSFLRTPQKRHPQRQGLRQHASASTDSNTHNTQDIKSAMQKTPEAESTLSTRDAQENTVGEDSTGLGGRRAQADHNDNGSDDDYIDIHIRVPKANATKLLENMMSEYSEDACCARWATDIDIDIDADARKRLAPGGNVARHSREMLNVALAQIHRHCGGWWSNRGPRVDQQKACDLAFYPLDEWVALPVPHDMRDSVAYPNAVIEERPSDWQSPVLDESTDPFAWCSKWSDGTLLAASTDSLDAVRGHAETTDTTAVAAESASPPGAQNADAACPVVDPLPNE
ncbi:hypothetical protein psal_cds_1391 [Pandoravirus salinus]|uniref:Uncharacterized protein n=1 Tax=Pandoravirus salinus TaxID=1349410 RepID=S4VYM6_9VIRU|nr:hypothetical protein psal_cds_1391 [Pandoravirus salinus]AGO85809.1 hypothetical protein psal_cds_1391 [Pandoravirus salinus]